MAEVREVDYSQLFRLAADLSAAVQRDRLVSSASQQTGQYVDGSRPIPWGQLAQSLVAFAPAAMSALKAAGAAIAAAGPVGWAVGAVAVAGLVTAGVVARNKAARRAAIRASAGKLDWELYRDLNTNEQAGFFFDAIDKSAYPYAAYEVECNYLNNKGSSYGLTGSDRDKPVSRFIRLPLVTGTNFTGRAWDYDPRVGLVPRPNSSDAAVFRNAAQAARDVLAVFLGGTGQDFQAARSWASMVVQDALAWGNSGAFTSIRSRLVDIRAAMGQWGYLLHAYRTNGWQTGRMDSAGVTFLQKAATVAGACMWIEYSKGRDLRNLQWYDLSFGDWPNGYPSDLNAFIAIAALALHGAIVNAPWSSIAATLTNTGPVQVYFDVELSAQASGSSSTGAGAGVVISDPGSRPVSESGSGSESGSASGSGSGPGSIAWLGPAVLGALLLFRRKRK